MMRACFLASILASLARSQSCANRPASGVECANNPFGGSGACQQDESTCSCWGGCDEHGFRGCPGNAPSGCQYTSMGGNTDSSGCVWTFARTACCLTCTTTTTTTLAPPVLGCSFGNGQRCGVCEGDTTVNCVDESYNCPNSQELYESFIFYSSPSLSSMDFCAAYMQVLVNQGDVTQAQLQAIETGVPHLSFAITKVVYDVAGDQDGCYSPPSNCKSSILQNGITGGDLQFCMNEYIVQCGETALEKAACVDLTSGVLASFCGSAVFTAATGLVNSFANKYLEKPIVKVMDNVEDALVGVAKTCASWFSGLFSLSNTSVVV